MRLLGNRVDMHMETSLRKVRLGGHSSQKQNRSAILRDISLNMYIFLDRYKRICVSIYYLRVLFRVR
jgi:hypothetical protein